MLIPLSDKSPNRYGAFSSVTIALIGLCVLIYALEEALYFNDQTSFLSLIYFFGVVPKWIWAQQGLGAVTVFTVTFLHGDLFHLGGNMLFLWAFGRRVEDACGRWRFLCFYFLCSATATIAHVIISGNKEIPAVGASGAISGVMAAYLMLYPWGRIDTFVFLIIPFRVRIRAFWLLIYFLFVTNLGPAIRALTETQNYGVAYWAHLGGLIGGVTIFFFLRPEALYRYWRQDAV